VEEGRNKEKTELLGRSKREWRGVEWSGVEEGRNKKKTELLGRSKREWRRVQWKKAGTRKKLNYWGGVKGNGEECSGVDSHD